MTFDFTIHKKLPCTICDVKEPHTHRLSYHDALAILMNPNVMEYRMRME